MTIHEHEGLLRAARAQGKTAEFTAAYPTRAGVERVLAHLATQNGRRVKLRYRGVDKNDAWLRTRAAASAQAPQQDHNTSRPITSAPRHPGRVAITHSAAPRKDRVLTSHQAWERKSGHGICHRFHGQPSAEPVRPGTTDASRHTKPLRG